MYRSLKDMRGYRLAATDDEIGKVKDIYFDDANWCMRYLVVDTGTWLPGRLVLISPAALSRPVSAEEVVPVNLTREQIEKSPDIGSDLPVSRQREAQLVQYYGWPVYWGPPGVAYGAGGAMIPPPTAADPSQAGDTGDSARAAGSDQKDDPHLRSLNEVLGYHIQADDGEIGHVEDLLVDDADWSVGYVVVDTRNWLPGRKVLVVPRWFSNVSWSDSKVRVSLARESIEKSPEYDPSRLLESDHEKQIRAYYESPNLQSTGSPLGTGK